MTAQQAATAQQQRPGGLSATAGAAAAGAVVGLVASGAIVGVGLAGAAAYAAQPHGADDGGCYS